MLKHDDGATFETIKNIIIKQLGYSFFHKVVYASDYGLPQHRPRLFIVGFKDPSVDFSFPAPQPLHVTMSDIFGEPCNREVGYTLRVGGRGSGLHDRRNWDTYLVNGTTRRLTSKEAKLMQGFPEGFEFPVSETQAMKQLGNSVAVPAIKAVATAILAQL